jgi:hypothetical protein
MCACTQSCGGHQEAGISGGVWQKNNKSAIISVNHTVSSGVILLLVSRAKASNSVKAGARLVRATASASARATASAKARVSIRATASV